jgi:orotate phosphoribosyltransferase
VQILIEQMLMSTDKEAMLDKFCGILKKIDALEFGTFKLSSGRVTPYYVDLRLISSFPDAFREVLGFCVDYVRTSLSEDFDRIAGIPIAGIPFASILAYHLNTPFIFIRQGVRLHGRERRVEGVLISGDRVLLVDDLITTGLSLRRAASAVRSEGGVVMDAFVLLDRQEDGKKRLSDEGVRVHSLFRIGEVAKRLYEMDVITEDQLETVAKQVKR